jgi:hypothetical protein
MDRHRYAQCNGSNCTQQGVSLPDSELIYIYNEYPSVHRALCNNDRVLVAGHSGRAV